MVTVKSAIETDLANRVNIFAASKEDEYAFIEQIETNLKGVQALSHFNKIANIFTVIALNNLPYTIQITIDASST